MDIFGYTLINAIVIEIIAFTIGLILKSIIGPKGKSKCALDVARKYLGWTAFLIFAGYFGFRVIYDPSAYNITMLIMSLVIFGCAAFAIGYIVGKLTNFDDYINNRKKRSHDESQNSTSLPHENPAPMIEDIVINNTNSQEMNLVVNEIDEKIFSEVASNDIEGENQEINSSYTQDDGLDNIFEIIKSMSAYEKNKILRYLKDDQEINALKMKYKIEDGESMDIIDEDGDTPLMKAIVNGEIEKIKLLLHNGADINIEKNGSTAKGMAHSLGDREIIELIDDHLQCSSSSLI